MADDKPELIKPPGTLQSKVTVGGPGAVDLDALERAESVIADLADDYLEWVQGDLEKIEVAFDALKASKSKDDLGRIFEIAHDMKGQGGSFGFDLMTAVGNQLCRLSESMDKVGERELQMIKIHIDAMRVIISQGMKGDGGDAGQALLDGLSMMLAKLQGQE